MAANGLVSSMPEPGHRIFVVGEHGQMAQALGRECTTRGHTVRLAGRATADFTDPAALAAAVADFQPELVVNTAAYTAPDKAEDETDQAFLLNRDGAAIGIGGASRLLPSHTTVHTGPYTAVRWIERTPVPAGGATAGVWKRVSPRTLRSLHHRAVGLHPSDLASRPGTTGVLPHGAVEMRVSTPHFHPFGPSADRST